MQKVKKKIGIDLDNVLNNLNFEWLKIYNLDNEDNLALEDIKCWDIHNYVKIGKDIYEYLNEDLLSILSPLPNSIAATRTLAKHFDLFIVTASRMHEMETKKNWVDKYFPHIGSENMIVSMRKDLINVDLLIDDASHNILEFPGETIVLDYPWNRDLDNSYSRATDWIDILRIINEKEISTSFNFTERSMHIGK